MSASEIETSIVSLQGPETGNKNADVLQICPVCGELTEERYSEQLIQKFPEYATRLRKRKCACDRKREAALEEERRIRFHKEKVQSLQKICFAGNPAMQDMTFVKSIVDTPAVDACRKYAAEWPRMYEDNIGLLLWGTVGSGKTYMAVSIANAVMEQEVGVRMINLSEVMNAGSESREAIIKEIQQCSLLILDDFGMERATGFGLENSFHVIDTRYRTRKPIIITTNLSLETLKQVEDLDHKRIYDRILEMCVPIRFVGNTQRLDIHRQKIECFKNMNTYKET